MDEIHPKVRKLFEEGRELEEWLRGCNVCGATMRVYESDPPTCGACGSENVVNYGHDERPSPDGLGAGDERGASGEPGKPDPAEWPDEMDYITDLQDAYVKLEKRTARLENAMRDMAMRITEMRASEDTPQGGSKR